MNSVDKTTIEEICDQIQRELESDDLMVDGEEIVTEMKKALAKLVAARAKNNKN